MLMTYKEPKLLFVAKVGAEFFAYNLGIDDTYGCSYNISFDNERGRYIIEIIDEYGDRVGYF